MLQGTIIRGTTPTHTFDLPYSQERVKDLRITYGQNKYILITKTLQDCTLSGNTLSVSLTQEETFSFSPSSNVFVEMRIYLTDKQVVRNEVPVELRVVDTMDTEVFR